MQPQSPSGDPLSTTGIVVAVVVSMAGSALFWVIISVLPRVLPKSLGKIRERLDARQATRQQRIDRMASHPQLLIIEQLSTLFWGLAAIVVLYLPGVIAQVIDEFYDIRHPSVSWEMLLVLRWGPIIVATIMLTYVWMRLLTVNQAQRLIDRHKIAEEDLIAGSRGNLMLLDAAEHKRRGLFNANGVIARSL